MLQDREYTKTIQVIVPYLNSIVVDFQMQIEIRIRPSDSLKMAEVMTRKCVDKVGPHFVYRGPLCQHHAYLSCMTPTSFAFCRNSM